MVLLPKLTMALGGYIRETVMPYRDDEATPFPYRNVIVGNPTNEPIKIDVPAYNDGWIERHKKLGLIIVPITENDDFVGLYKMVLEKVKQSE